MIDNESKDIGKINIIVDKRINRSNTELINIELPIALGAVVKLMSDIIYKMSIKNNYSLGQRLDFMRNVVTKNIEQEIIKSTMNNDKI